MGFLGLSSCAPWYYLPPPQHAVQYPYQPAVVMVKSCDCPPQGLGFVRIQSAPPFASVYVNGKSQGETPLEYVTIPAGEAHIEIVHRQFGPSDTVIQVHPGEKIDLKMRLSQGNADAIPAAGYYEEGSP